MKLTCIFLFKCFCTMLHLTKQCQCYWHWNLIYNSGSTDWRSFPTLMLMFIINVAITIEIFLLYSFVLHVFYPSFFILGKFHCIIPYIHLNTSKMQSFRFLQLCSWDFQLSEIQHCVTGWLVLEPIGMVSYPRKIETSFTSIRHFSVVSLLQHVFRTSF
jgi:hypothetical protein